MENNKNLSDMSIVTEIGAFGSLNIEDPTVTRVRKKDDDTDGIDEEALDALIQESVQKNLNIGQ